MEVGGGKGFLHLQEDHSRRSSLHPQSSLGGEATFSTRFPICCGHCPIKVEREEGNGLRIGRLTLAPYCHIALSIFGLCFILAGGILTGLAYNKENITKQDQKKSQEEKIAGPLFLIAGILLLILGFTLGCLGCKLEATERKQRLDMNRFSFDARSSDIFANLEEVQHRRGSWLSSTFNPTSSRRSTLSTIVQAVPISLFPNDLHQSPNSLQIPIKLEETEFQDVELASPGEEFTLPALTLRPSIFNPISNFVSPSHNLQPVSRSDEPFGSIVSLKSNGAIASFPAARPKTANANSSVNCLTPIRVSEGGNALTVSDTNKKPLRATKSQEEHSIGDVVQYTRPFSGS